MKLKIGNFYKEEFIITQEMVNQFAKLSGDKILCISIKILPQKQDLKNL